MTDELGDALLPCPFCGEADIDPEEWASLDTKGPCCPNCGASAGLISKTPIENIAAWNTRATHAADRQTIGAVGEATDRPWRVVHYGDGDSLAIHDARGDWRVCFMATPSRDGDFAGIEANAELIVAAVNERPDLTAQVATLTAERDAAWEALQWIADMQVAFNAHPVGVIETIRELARAALPTTGGADHG